MPNPLLGNHAQPAFGAIDASHVQPAVDAILAQNRAELTALLDNNSEYSWDNLVRPIEEQDDRLSRAWSPVSHLNAVMNSDEMRDAYNACLPQLSEYSTEIGQNRRLYKAYQSIADGPEYQSLDEAQQKVIDNTLRNFRLAGVALEEAEKDRYKSIMQRLSQLTSTFQDNVLDATQAWEKHITEESDLSGLPPSALGLANQTAESKDLSGWLLNLEFPCYFPIMTYADNRGLREEMYRAYVTRASETGPNAGQWDNTPVINEILELRREAALLLGFSSYAELSLATKMAESVATVSAFLGDLAQRSRPQAQQELAEITAYARELGHNEPLRAWDVNYFAEKLRQNRYQISQEELRPYFPETAVVPGLFAVIEKLYGFVVKPVDDMETWHSSVRCYEIRDADGVRGRFYFDLYARANKRGGAWMDGAVNRRQTDSGLQLPVAYMVCNFTPPVAGKPALFTHEEVLTLFHEFGHGLHHLLTQINYAAVSGINGVEWDAVELPSQFMENWCWEREALNLISGHVDSGEKIPDDLYERMIAAKNFQAAMQMVRQLEFSLFDFRIHHEFEPGLQAQTEQLLAEVRASVAVIDTPDFNRFANSFSHIFAGGYAAGYYSYKWAEVLSSDAFSQFEENGIFDKATGEAFLANVLEVGGSRDALVNFTRFRGRKPKIEPLLRHSGIAAQALR